MNENGVPTASVYGLSSAITAFIWLLTRRNDRNAGKILYFILGVTLAAFFLPTLLEVDNRLLPWKYDRLLYEVDRAMVISILRISAVTPDWLFLTFCLIYKSLPWVMTILAAVNMTRTGDHYRQMVTAFVVAYGIAGFLYIIVPACGPAYAMKWFNGSVAPMILNEAPNAMPSLHMTSAVLLLIFCGTGRWWRCAMAVYLIGIAGGTVLAGEHYFIDWLPALPLALFATFFARREYSHAVMNLSLVVFFLLLLRMVGPSMVAHPAILWLMAIATAWSGSRDLAAIWRTDVQTPYAFPVLTAPIKAVR